MGLDGISPNDVVTNISEACIMPELNRVTSKKEWVPPCEGFLKFNVDGSAFGKPGLAGIGSVLRDDKGVIKAVFLVSIGIVDSNCAEILAIWEAMLMISSNPVFGSSQIIIESDFHVALSWIEESGEGAWRYNSIINEILNLRSAVKFSFANVSRAKNSLAYFFAKQRVGRLFVLKAGSNGSPPFLYLIGPKMVSQKSCQVIRSKIDEPNEPSSCGGMLRSPISNKSGDLNTLI